MPGPDERRLLAHLAERGGAVSASANLDPQWNATTAETKHRRDLHHRLAADAGLDAAPGAVADAVADLADRGLVARESSAEAATLRLTAAGAEAVGETDDPIERG